MILKLCWGVRSGKNKLPPLEAAEAVKISSQFAGEERPYYDKQLARARAASIEKDELPKKRE